MHAITYDNELITLLEQSAHIGWWRADFGKQTLVMSEYLTKLVGVRPGEIPLEELFNKIKPGFRERMISEASLTTSEIGFFEYRFPLCGATGEVWMLARMCKTTLKDDGSFIVEGFARCLDDSDEQLTASDVMEKVEPLLHWQTVASKLVLKMIYGEDPAVVFRDTLNVVRDRYKCDRAFMVMFDHKAQQFSCKYESRAEGCEPAENLIDKKDFSRAPWVVPAMVSGQLVVLDNIDDMPQEAALEKAFLARHGVASTIISPLISEKGAWGYFGIASSTPRQWNGMEREWLVAMSYFLSVCFELSRSQRKLAHESENLKSLYMNMPLGFARLKLIYDGEQLTDFAVMDTNNTMADHTGFQRSELMKVGKREIDQVFKGFDDMMGLFERVASSGGIEDREILNTLTGRHYRQTLYSPRKQEMVVLSMDITSNIKASAALHRSDQLLRMVYQNIQVGIEIYDKDAMLISANDAAYNIFHIDKNADITGINMFDWPSFAMQPDMKERVLLGEEVAFDMTYDAKMANPEMAKDTPKHLSFQCLIIRDQESNVENYLLIIIDNTEKIQTYLDLKKFQHTFDSISEFAELGMFELDLTDNSIMATDQWYHNMNLECGSSLEDVRKVLHPDDMTVMQNYVKEIHAGSRADFACELRIRNGRGWKWIRSMCQVTECGPGKGNLGISGLNLNISGMKAVEHNLLKAKLKAEESDRIKSAFLASMSHEIRTPLNAIVGFSSLLGETADENERNNYINIIERSNRQLLALVSDILNFSTIEAGIFNIIPADVNVDQMMGKLVESLISDMPDGVRLIYESTGDDVTIYSDWSRIQQIVSQFINNAGKFTRKGHVRAGYRMDGQEIEFWVEDTGIGMTPEQAAAAFDRFVKFDEFAQGTGLGLSICKSIAEVMGGKIGVETKAGRGSRFWFRIPATVNPGPVNTKSAELPVTANKHVILVAEDAELNYMLVLSMLQNEYRILHARNGLEAVSMYRKHKPDLVLMDIKMPVMDGLDATRLIRQENVSVPVIALTAFAMDNDRKSAFDAGCTGFLSKPIITGEIRSVLRKYLSEDQA